MKYLTFMLADQYCGIDLSCVRELLGYMPYTTANAEHPAMVGWFELRGRRVRVIDVRSRFGLPVTRTDDTVMVITELSGETIAMIVDKVSGLERLASMSPIASNQRSRIDSRFLIGAAQIGDRRLLLLDLSRTLNVPRPMPRAA